MTTALAFLIVALVAYWALGAVAVSTSQAFLIVGALLVTLVLVLVLEAVLARGGRGALEDGRAPVRASWRVWGDAVRFVGKSRVCPLPGRRSTIAGTTEPARRAGPEDRR